MRYYSYYLLVFASLFLSCSSDEPASPDEQPTQPENLYLDFNKWVYSEMNRQYLWREDLPDSLECNFDLSPKQFFESILSPKDRFSYFTSNPYYNGGSSQKNPDQYDNIPISANKDIGFAYQEYTDRYGNSALQVLYVRSTNARHAGLKRGDLVKIENQIGNYISLSKVSYIDGELTPSDVSLGFTVGDANKPRNSVLLDSIYNLGDKRIGYLCYLEYDQISDLREPLNDFYNHGITDLVLDLRYNPGGYVRTSRFLCNCIVPKEAYGGIFQQCTYNDILSAEYLKKTGSEKTFSYFSFPNEYGGNVLGTPLLSLNLQRIIILTSKRTASASEATIICMRPYMEIVTIGEQTVGKGVGSWTIYDNKYRYAIQPITMRYYNSNGETTPDEGIVPDFYIPNGYSTTYKEIGDIEEPLLKAALELILGGSISPDKVAPSHNNIEKSLTPVGEPSYLIEFKNKHYNENF